MVDALPYLVDYPYGCTEQTLNRFLPTVITQKVLLDMELDLKEIEKKRTNLNAQEIGDDRRAGRSSGSASTTIPVFDEDEVRRMVKDGVERLDRDAAVPTAAGAGSPAGANTRSPHTTAIVVHGLQIAQQNDVALVPGVLERGVAWLKSYQDEQVQLLKNAADQGQAERLRWKDHGRQPRRLGLHGAGRRRRRRTPTCCEFLYRDRTHLAVYAWPCTAWPWRSRARRRSWPWSCGTSASTSQQDDENQTAWLNLPGGLLVVLVRQRVRGRGLLPEAAGADRSQGRDWPGGWSSTC